MLALVASLLLGFAAAGRVLPSPEIVNGYTSSPSASSVKANTM